MRNETSFGGSHIQRVLEKTQCVPTIPGWDFILREEKKSSRFIIQPYRILNPAQVNQTNKDKCLHYTSKSLLPILFQVTS